LELDNNAAERGMRAIALGRKNYLFVGSEAGGKAAAIAYTLIETAKLNAVDPHAWLADTLARIPDYKITKVDDLRNRPAWPLCRECCVEDSVHYWIMDTIGVSGDEAAEASGLV
jgi:hypothetical protein